MLLHKNGTGNGIGTWNGLSGFQKIMQKYSLFQERNRDQDPLFPIVPVLSPVAQVLVPCSVIWSHLQYETLMFLSLIIHWRCKWLFWFYWGENDVWLGTSWVLTFILMAKKDNTEYYQVSGKQIAAFAYFALNFNRKSQKQKTCSSLKF